MQAYDLIMLIVLGMATLFGAIKGFAWQVASLASILVSYIVAYRFRFQVAEMIEAKPPWNQFLAMLILYVGTSFVIWVGFRLLSGVIDKVRLKEFDRHLGAAFGLAKGVIFCLLITMFAMSLLGPNQQAAICQSRSGFFIATALDRGVGVLPKEIHDVVGPYLANLDGKLKDGLQGLPRPEGNGFSFPIGLEQFQQGLPNMSGGIAEALSGAEGFPGAEALRGLALPGVNQQPSMQNPGEPAWPWNQQNPGSGFAEPSGSGVFPLQDFPPLSTNGQQPPAFNPAGTNPAGTNPSGAGGFNFNTGSGANGLRPINGNQAQQPGLVLPR